MDTSSCRLEDFSLLLNAETCKTVLYFYLSFTILCAGGEGHFLRIIIGPPNLTDELRRISLVSECDPTEAHECFRECLVFVPITL